MAENKNKKNKTKYLSKSTYQGVWKIQGAQK